MNDSGEIVGMVDVLKLTYATLEQVRPKTYSRLGLWTDRFLVDQLDGNW